MQVRIGGRCLELKYVVLKNNPNFGKPFPGVVVVGQPTDDQIDQQRKIAILHKEGFYINPTQIGGKCETSSQYFNHATRNTAH